MPTIRVLSVSFEEAPSSELRGAHLDRPRAGAEADSSVLPLVGWVLGRGTQPGSVEVLYEDRVLAVAPVRVPRPDVAAAHPEADTGDHHGFRALVDVFELPAELQLQFVAVFPDGARAPIGSIRLERQTAPEGAATDGEAASGQEPIPSMREQLRKLILETVEASEDLDPSDVESVRRQLEHPGERDASGVVLDGVDLYGKRVLDLTAGIGDLCRAARSAGAALVDGLEPDPRLARLARLLNAYQPATRVSIFDGDDALAQLPAERYDVVLALRGAEALTTSPDRVAELCSNGVLIAPAGAGEEIERRFSHQRELPSDEDVLVVYSASEAALAAIVRR